MATSVTSGNDGLQAVAKNPPDLILLDMLLPGIDGLEVLRELRGRGQTAPVVVMTAYRNIDSAVEVMKSGGSDYLTKPVDLTELELVVARVLEHSRVAVKLDYFRERERASSAFDAIIGASPPMLAVKRFVERLVASPALPSDSPHSVLMTGETGAGKGLLGISRDAVRYRLEKYRGNLTTKDAEKRLTAEDAEERRE